MENPDVLEYYSDKFKYILVDEYQDTNKSQFTLVTMLASKYGNITVVGDNDQGIYSFRGADISNILNFEKDFPGTKIIKLEQNYRCTGNILNAANAVIEKVQKTLQEPEVRKANTEQIKKKARTSVLEKLAANKKRVAEENAARRKTKTKYHDRDSL